MPIELRWVEPGRLLGILVTDAANADLGEELRVAGDFEKMSTPERRALIDREIAESCARTGAKP